MNVQDRPIVLPNLTSPTPVMSGPLPSAPIASFPMRAVATSAATATAFAGWLPVFVGAHVVLGMVMRALPPVATVHAFGSAAIGVLVAATTRRSRNVAFAVAYIAGAEVLWRITRAGVFYEFGKYTIVLILMVALMRVRDRRNVALAFGYFALLLPSVLLTLVAFDLDEARQQISFNLSGPLSLACCVAFFSNVRLTPNDVRDASLALIAPALGIATLTYFSTAAFREVQFTGDSNFATSAGFGPNQVSAVLGLGLLLSLLQLMERRQSLRLRVMLLIIAPILAVQAALTFSRGGLVLAFAGAFVAIFYLVRDRQTRVTLLILGVLMFGLGKYVVVPRLDVFTQGKISERYTSADSSGRTKLATFDLEIFQEAPIMGVGPGAGALLRKERGHFGAAHTEFTRLLAEHGLFGAMAMILLVGLGIRTFRRAKTTRARAYVVAMLVWITLFLAINAMRIVAPSFLLGLACAVSYSSKREPAPPTRALRPDA